MKLRTVTRQGRLRLGLVLALSCVPVLLGATPAGAQPVANAQGMFGTPDLAGDWTYFAQESGLNTVVYAAADNGSSVQRIVTAIARRTAPGLDDVSFGADPAGLALGISVTGVTDVHPELPCTGDEGCAFSDTQISLESFVFPKGKTTRVFTCRPAAKSEKSRKVLPGVAGGGGLMIAVGRRCAASRVLMYDIATGALVNETDALGDEVERIAAAPGYVAWVALTDGYARTLVVYDVTARAVAYTHELPPKPLPGLGGDDPGPRDISVQSDGSAVVVTPTGKGAPGCAEAFVADWYSRAEPAPHRLPQVLCVPEARIAADRVALVRSSGRGTRQLVLTDLGGQVVRPIADFRARPSLIESYLQDVAFRCLLVGPELLNCTGLRRTLDELESGSGFDWDGTRVAWRDVGCEGQQLSVVDVAATPAVVPPTECPVQVGAVTSLKRARVIRVALRCPKGCYGSIGIRAPRSLMPFSDDETPAFDRIPDFVIAPKKQRGTVDITLPVDEAKGLRRRKKVTLQLLVLGTSTTLLKRTLTVKP